MNIIGINAFHADASAAIFKNGQLIAATEEERFTRKKHQGGFPKHAVGFCLQQAGLSFKDIDIITIGRNPKAKLAKKIIFASKNLLTNGIGSRIKNSREISTISSIASQVFSNNANEVKQKLRFIEHHRSHLASAFFGSPFESALCVSIDGSGDFTTTMFASGHLNKITPLESIDFPHSFGIFYTAFTQFLGFPHYGDEYKMMGLASYGKPTLVHKVEQVLQPTNFKLNLNYFTNPASGILIFNESEQPIVQPLFNNNFVNLFGKPRLADEPLTDYHKDLAASTQYVLEQRIFSLLNGWQKRTNQKNLCLAGGVIQNSVLNGKIIANTYFENIYIPAAAHDAGVAMGSAMHWQHEVERIERRIIKSAYSGASYSNEYIAAFLNSRQLPYRMIEDEELFEILVKDLSDGRVVGWFSGQAEFGPRALGARSILFDPRRIEAKNILNEKIKRRENFRPFAPSVLLECLDEYFDNPQQSPFMEKVFKVKPAMKDKIPAVVHVDGTARLHTVDIEANPRFYKLIKRFQNNTGIPMLLNTSFNENEPIVNSPQDALDCFLSTGMDTLAMENVIISRNT